MVCNHSFYGVDRECLWCGKIDEPLDFKGNKQFRLFMDKSYIGDNVCVLSILDTEIKGAMEYACKYFRIHSVETIEESDRVISFKGSIGITGYNKEVFRYKIIAV